MKKAWLLTFLAASLFLCACVRACIAQVIFRRTARCQKAHLKAPAHTTGSRRPFGVQHRKTPSKLTARPLHVQFLLARGKGTSRERD